MRFVAAVVAVAMFAVVLTLIATRGLIVQRLLATPILVTLILVVRFVSKACAMLTFGGLAFPLRVVRGLMRHIAVYSVPIPSIGLCLMLVVASQWLERLLALSLLDITVLFSVVAIAIATHGEALVPHALALVCRDVVPITHLL